MRGEGGRHASSTHQFASEGFLSRAFRPRDTDFHSAGDKDTTTSGFHTIGLRKTSGGGGGVVGIRVLPEDQFQVSLGRLMRSMVSLSVRSPTVASSDNHNHSNSHSNSNKSNNNNNNIGGDRFSTGRGISVQGEHAAMHGFRRELSNARDQTMALLSAACMESYGRAYPFLVRLHILQEIESGSRLVMLATAAGTADLPKPPASSVAPAHLKRTPSRGAGAVTDSTGTTKTPLETEMENLQWDSRLKLMSNTVRERSATLAVRRSVLGAAHMRSSMMETWVDWSKAMRQNRRFDAARIALRHAEVNHLLDLPYY